MRREETRLHPADVEQRSRREDLCNARATAAGGRRTSLCVGGLRGSTMKSIHHYKQDRQMESAESTVTLAILIDADNASPSIIQGLMDEVAKLGRATVRRIYGDWTTPNLATWKTAL